MVYTPSKQERRHLASMLIDGAWDGHRSCFRAALGDARHVAQRDGRGKLTVGEHHERNAIWSSALLYLALVDQVGAAFTTDPQLDQKLRSAKGKKIKEGVSARFRRALSEHAQWLSEDERYVLWGLRNSFAHNYSAANTEGEAEGRHIFELGWQKNLALPGIVIPQRNVRWDGDLTNYNVATQEPTRVNLYAVEKWSEQLARNVEKAARAGNLLLATDSWDEFLLRFTIHVWVAARPSMFVTNVPVGTPAVTGVGRV